MSREPGFYWVRDACGWLVAQAAITGNKWLSPGHTNIVDDSFWQEIGPAVEIPEIVQQYARHRLYDRSRIWRCDKCNRMVPEDCVPTVMRSLDDEREYNPHPCQCGGRLKMPDNRDSALSPASP